MGHKSSERFGRIVGKRHELNFTSPVHWGMAQRLLEEGTEKLGERGFGIKKMDNQRKYRSAVFQ